MSLSLKLPVVALLAAAVLPVSAQTVPGIDPCLVLEVQEPLQPLLTPLEAMSPDASPAEEAAVRGRNLSALRQDVAALEAYIKEGEAFAERTRTQGCSEVAGRVAERLHLYRGFLKSTREHLKRQEAEAGLGAGYILGQAGSSASGSIEGEPVRPPRAALPAPRAVLRGAEAAEPSPVWRSVVATANALNGVSKSLGAGAGTTGSGAAVSGFFDGTMAP